MLTIRAQAASHSTFTHKLPSGGNNADKRSPLLSISLISVHSLSNWCPISCVQCDSVHYPGIDPPRRYSCDHFARRCANLPQNKGLGAVAAIAAAAAFSISTKQPSMVDRTPGCDRTFKSRYRFGASNSRIFNAACDQHDRSSGSGRIHPVEQGIPLNRWTPDKKYYTPGQYPG